MSQIKTTSSRSYSTIKYDNLKGVDFSSEPEQVSRMHSPDGLNMIPDDNCDPVKRHGWEVWKTLGNDAILNLWTYKTDDGEMIVASTGKKLYRINPNGEVAEYTVSGGSAKRLAAAQTNDGLLILTPAGLVLCNNSGAFTAAGSPYVPTIVVGKTPSGEGAAYEGVNMLTRQVKETYYPDGTADYCAAMNVDTSMAVVAKVNGTVVSGVTVKVDSVKQSLGMPYNYFQFATAPAKADSDYPTVEITYYAAGDGTENKIFNAKDICVFSEGAGQRWFIAEEDSNIVRYSEIDNYLFWPDNNYVVAGSSLTSVQGLIPVNANLGVLKETSDRDSSLYYIAPTALDDTATATDASGKLTVSTVKTSTFKLQHAVAGVGAITPECIAALQDEPLFLSEQGIYAIASQSLTSETVMKNRSVFLNGKLKKEAELSKAAACIHKTFYVLAVNEHLYLLDSRQKTSTQNANGSYAYESYYCDNVPARSLVSADGILYFGTADGKLCRFGESYTDNGTAIRAVWSTAADDDGSPQYLKTMQKKGSLITLKPDIGSRVLIYAAVDGKERELLKESYINAVNNGLIDRFIGKKVKKYHRMQLIVENAEPEPFGITAFVKTYLVAKYAKK